MVTPGPQFSHRLRELGRRTNFTEYACTYVVPTYVTEIDSSYDHYVGQQPFLFGNAIAPIYQHCPGNQLLSGL